MKKIVDLIEFYKKSWIAAQPTRRRVVISIVCSDCGNTLHTFDGDAPHCDYCECPF
jgi:hypothetical protein